MNNEQERVRKIIENTINTFARGYPPDLKEDLKQDLWVSYLTDPSLKTASEALLYSVFKNNFLNLIARNPIYSRKKRIVAGLSPAGVEASEDVEVRDLIAAAPPRVREALEAAYTDSEAPWKVLGISRASWFRRRQEAAAWLRSQGVNR